MVQDQDIPADTATEAPSRCPVQQTGSDASEGKAALFWTRFIAPSSLGNKHGQDTENQQHQSLPDSLEEAVQHAQCPQPDQTFSLGNERQVSSIPRKEDTATTPHHQLNSRDSNRWVYPSEQQLYNAMRKKGWSNVPEESIPTVLQIHNHINEYTWKQIQSWEGSQDLVLSKFQGRPKDITPKAFFLSYILRRYDPPFDRHDWYIINKNNQSPQYEQRYVIDYYYLPPPLPHLPPVPFVDARPALDHPRAVWLRCRRFAESAFPGIFTAIKGVPKPSLSSSSSTNPTTTTTNTTEKDRP